ncbi:MAG: hypothetical protein RIF41_01910 [Polyangiaceae bacterium]
MNTTSLAPYLFDVVLGVTYLALFLYMLVVAVGDVPDDEPREAGGETPVETLHPMVAPKSSGHDMARAA